jgi:hypothetical protein
MKFEMKLFELIGFKKKRKPHKAPKGRHIQPRATPCKYESWIMDHGSWIMDHGL